MWAVLACGCACASSAAADDWMPHPPAAVWHYTWSDSIYNSAGTQEVVTVCSPTALTAPCPTTAWDPGAGGFALGWASENDPPYAQPESGYMFFQDGDGGMSVSNWSSSPPPAQMPVLCASGDTCANSLAGALYNVVWGGRSPVLSEPLLKGLTWTSTGGSDGDVTSANEYVGQQAVQVPAFKGPVLADVVRSAISQTGELGAPYGSGTRTTWWVRGVGPVKTILEHAGGAGAPVTTVTLNSTNLTPQAPPPDVNYFPMTQGATATYRWTNKRHLPQPEIEKVKTELVSNRSEDVSVKSVSGPIRVEGIYGYSVTLSGVTSTSSEARANLLVRLPRLGHNRHFFTPLDLMNFGFNPVLPAYPARGATWSGGAGGRDFSIYGVTGKTSILGVQKVHVPAGAFHALAVKTVMRQRGHRWGSGVRVAWFAPGRGLVKLRFKHADGSVSLVQLIRH